MLQSVWKACFLTALGHVSLFFSCREVSLSNLSLSLSSRYLTALCLELCAHEEYRIRWLVEQTLRAWEPYVRTLDLDRPKGGERKYVLADMAVYTASRYPKQSVGCELVQDAIVPASTSVDPHPCLVNNVAREEHAQRTVESIHKVYPQTQYLYQW